MNQNKLNNNLTLHEVYTPYKPLLPRKLEIYSGGLFMVLLLLMVLLL